MNQQNFAQFLGMAPATLSSILSERTKPTLNTIEAIKNKFPNINIDWLMFGKGSMFLDENPGSQTQARAAVRTDVVFKEREPRKITEIRVFYDDQTWESFVPKK